MTAKSQQTKGHQFMVTPAGKKIDLGEINEQDKVHFQPREPQGPTPTVSQIGNTPGGDPVFATNRLDKDNHPMMMTIENGEYVPYMGKIVPKPTGSDANKGPKVVSSTENAKYSTLRGLAAKEPDGFFFSAPGVKVKNSVAFQQYEQGLLGKFPPDIVTSVKQAIKTVPPGTSNEDLVKVMTAKKIIQPGEEQTFYSLLQTLR